ncbi:MAG: HD domain-containing protein [Spirochaetaceae bacterium]|nr:HD domain-containing protein [Spirochaetaceae bacterium]
MSDDGLLRSLQSIDDESEAELLDVIDDEEVSGIDPLPVDSISSISNEWLIQKNRLEVPLVLMDSQLTIRWRNDAFRTFRETKGLEYRGRPFHALFSTFAEHVSREELIVSLKNPVNGFGWNGRVTGRGQENRQFIAEINIIPLEYEEDDQPEWYLAVITDVTESIKAVVRANFDSILQASLLKDEDTGNHVERVNAYSRAIAEKLKGQLRWMDTDNNFVDDDFIEEIGILAAFHDVGKIGTPEVILLKNENLNEEEWKVMREHPINGALILDVHSSPMVKEIARSHHERWDGSGYPFALAEDDIPLAGRIVAIADVYDALRTRRPYKEPYSEEKAYGIIVSDSGTHFDPSLIEVFKDLRDDFNRIFNSMSDE